MAELTTIARPYAKAAFLFAQESDALDQWEQMLGLVASVAEDTAMHEFLDQPGLDGATKTQAFVDVCGEQLDEKGVNFIAQMAEHKRLDALPVVFQLYHELLAQSRQTTEVELISAYDLDDAETGTLVAALKKRLGRDVTVSSRVDPSLIGGVLVRAGDTVIDGSVRGRLDRLAEQLNS